MTETAHQPATQKQALQAGLILDAYIAMLDAWLASQPPAEDADTGFLTGSWELSDGAGTWVVTDQSFSWYRGQKPEGDVYRGAYTLRPGALVHQGFILDQGSPHTACYSLLAHITTDTRDGATTPADRRTLFTIQQMGTRNDVSILDQTTATRLTGRRNPRQ